MTDLVVFLLFFFSMTQIYGYVVTYLSEFFAVISWRASISTPLSFFMLVPILLSHSLHIFPLSSYFHYFGRFPLEMGAFSPFLFSF